MSSVRHQTMKQVEPLNREGDAKAKAVPALKPVTLVGTGGPAKAGLVAQPVDFLLDKLPGSVGGRIQPLYGNYAQPAVAKLDSALLAVANRGSRIIGGARARLFKARSTMDLEGMNRPGLLARAVGACERTLDRVLPPTPIQRFPGEDAAEPSCSSSEVSDEEEPSTFRRALDLVTTFRTRVYIRSEVKLIMLKVNVKVWYDLNVVRPYQRLVVRPSQRVLGKAQSLVDATHYRARIAKDATLDFADRTTGFAMTKYAVVRSAVAERLAAVVAVAVALQNKAMACADRTTGFAMKKYAVARCAVAERFTAAVDAAAALKNKAATGLEEAIERIEDRILPYTEALKERVLPDALRKSAGKFASVVTTAGSVPAHA